MKLKQTKKMPWGYRDTYFEVDPNRISAVITDMETDKSVLGYSVSPEKNRFDDVQSIKIRIKYDTKHINRHSEKNLLQNRTATSILVVVNV